MASLLKDIYSQAFYSRFCKVLSSIVPGASEEKFLPLVFNEEWNQKELKARMRHTAVVLHRFLPLNYKQAVKKMEQLIDALENDEFTNASLEFMFLPDYIECYGLEDFDTSVKAIERVTQFTSCEFAVRPFLIRYGERMNKQMLSWSLHNNYKVRRLATEGIRPRLPWAMAVPALKKDPTPVLSVLENLKQDPAAWVRRSVANNLNDITRDHPAVVLSTIREWRGTSKETDEIIRHGCRTLLKQGHHEVLEYFGLQPHKGMLLSDFVIHTEKVKIGSVLTFGFTIGNTTKQARVIRLEYAVSYKRLNGAYSKKVFKISERNFLPGEKKEITRNQSFRLITTRKFYPGEHKLSIIVNGAEKASGIFWLS